MTLVPLPPHKLKHPPVISNLMKLKRYDLELILCHNYHVFLSSCTHIFPLKESKQTWFLKLSMCPSLKLTGKRLRVSKLCLVRLLMLTHTVLVLKGKAVPLQAWSGPEGSRKLRFSDFMTMAQDGGKVVSLTHRPPLPPGNTPGTHFC